MINNDTDNITLKTTKQNQSYNFYYCRFQISFQLAEWKFVVNFLIKFPNVEVRCELHSEPRKFIANFRSTFSNSNLRRENYF